MPQHSYHMDKRGIFTGRQNKCHNIHATIDPTKFALRSPLLTTFLEKIVNCSAAFGCRHIIFAESTEEKSILAFCRVVGILSVLRFASHGER